MEASSSRSLDPAGRGDEVLTGLVLGQLTSFSSCQGAFHASVWPAGSCGPWGTALGAAAPPTTTSPTGPCQSRFGARAFPSQCYPAFRPPSLLALDSRAGDLEPRTLHDDLWGPCVNSKNRPSDEGRGTGILPSCWNRGGPASHVSRPIRQYRPRELPGLNLAWECVQCIGGRVEV